MALGFPHFLHNALLDCDNPHEDSQKCWTIDRDLMVAKSHQCWCRFRETDQSVCSDQIWDLEILVAHSSEKKSRIQTHFQALNMSFGILLVIKD